MDSTPAPEAAPGASSSSAAAAEDLAGDVAAMSLDERFDLLRGIGEECIQEDELRNLLQKKPVPICYDGFEPSGRMHIAQVRPFCLLLPLPGPHLVEKMLSLHDSGKDRLGRLGSEL